MYGCYSIPRVRPLVSLMVEPWDTCQTAFDNLVSGWRGTIVHHHAHDDEPIHGKGSNAKTYREKVNALCLGSFRINGHNVPALQSLAHLTLRSKSGVSSAILDPGLSSTYNGTGYKPSAIHTDDQPYKC